MLSVDLVTAAQDLRGSRFRARGPNWSSSPTKPGGYGKLSAKFVHPARRMADSARREILSIMISLDISIGQSKRLAADRCGRGVERAHGLEAL